MKELNHKLMKICDESGMTTKEISEKTGIYYTHLARMRNNAEIKPHRVTKKALADVLGPQVYSAFEDKALKGPR